jgi:DNA-binding NtrC family response regulator
MPKILLAGHDVRLLETGAAVLKKTGAEVLYCTGSYVLDVLVSEKPDLVVLCHSLGRGEAEALADKIRGCCPKTRVLMVVSQGSEEKQYQDAKFDAMILPEPVRLIKRATELSRDLLTTMRERMDATGGCLWHISCPKLQTRPYGLRWVGAS